MSAIRLRVPSRRSLPVGGPSKVVLVWPMWRSQAGLDADIGEPAKLQRDTLDGRLLAPLLAHSVCVGRA